MTHPRPLSEMLVCPESRTRLLEADSDLVDRINQAISAGLVKNRAGQTLKFPLDGGLLREDGQLLYPVIDRIPNLLVDRAIPLDQLSESP